MHSSPCWLRGGGGKLTRFIYRKGKSLLRFSLSLSLSDLHSRSLSPGSKLLTETVPVICVFELAELSYKFATVGTWEVNSRKILSNFQGNDWRAIGGESQKDPSAGVKSVPEYYFLRRRSLPSAIAFYRSCIAVGIGTGMLLEIQINKKVKEDGGVIWEFDK
ncbi:hypothetical protein Dsin_014101 [Dipteronia sinensis]|uniref:Uncharacterized protein n=1 Tax=Dipteronia sinensis TaxID=43782 RepID=A0AAE0E9M0_9ROSI|nr:hypothetical protein Dsin_014101 [Dipteronia sinensis]